MKSRIAAFSLVEMLVATAILTMIMAVILGVTQMAGTVFRKTSSKIEAFQEARSAFAWMTRSISYATLNPYWGYDSHDHPTRYLRKSDLHFVMGRNLLSSGSIKLVTDAIFFQTPMGVSSESRYETMTGLLNACGFYIEYNQDSRRPAFVNEMSPGLPNRSRYRLMQWIQNTENLTIYTDASSGMDSRKWFLEPLGVRSGASSRPLAENIVALILIPKTRNSSGGKKLQIMDYDYDSKKTSSNGAQSESENQLPPVVEVIMVAVDEGSFSKLGNHPDHFSLGQDGLFENVNKFDTDLEKFQDILNAKPNNIAGNKIPFQNRTFRAEIPLWNSQ